MQRRPRRVNEKHRRWIAERPCVICTVTPCHAAHIKFADARVCKPLSSNIGMKADDRFCVSLCEKHHMQQHSMGERNFWEQRKLDPILIALNLYSISGDDEEADHFILVTAFSALEIAPE